MEEKSGFNEIWKKYYSLISSVASTFPERHREDLIQEGLISLEKACRTFDSSKGVPFDAYIHICVKRAMISAYGKLISDEGDVSLDEIELAGPESDFVEKKYIEDIFAKLRSQLSELENRVLDGYLADKSYDEIADSLGISTKKVDNTLSSIKKKLKKI